MKPAFPGGSLFAVLLLAAPAAGQEAPEVPEDLQETYGAFATALVEGRADEAIEFYAEDAVVLVDSEHVYRGRSTILEGFLRAYLQAPGGGGGGGPDTEIRVDGVVGGEDVVTLAGRYTNPAEASGVYSNTWERQADGSWKLAASVMTFEATDGARAAGRDSVGSAPELLRRPYTSSGAGREREYFVYLPRGYHDAPRKDWPVVLYLHGSGERGDGREDLGRVLSHGPLHEAWIQKRDLPFVIVSPQLPVFGRTEQVEEGRSSGGRQPPGRLEEGTPPRYEICPPVGEGECVIAPHRRAFDRTRGEARPIARTGADELERIRPFGMDFDYPPEEWPPDGWFRVEADLLSIVDDVLDAFRADPDRVYLTGISYGGFGAFDLAASRPDRWAALAPVVGTGDLEDAPALADAGVPIWMFAGGADPLIKPHWLYEMARALEEAGHPNVRLTVHEDMAHDAWRRVYAGRDLYDWFLSQRRSNR